MLLSFVILILLIALVWEGAKWLGGDPWRVEINPFGIEHTPRYDWKIASDLNLPHLWTIAQSYAEPSRRNGPPLIDTLVSAGLFTFREAVTGFLFGSFLGLLLGIIFAHSNLLERGLMPYVVASQTVPILAIAPMVIIWLKAGWVSVAVISAYLTFFPVTINTLRGLRSPDPIAVELMRSYAASNWQTLWKLRFPAALPYIFTALKVSATASVVGAIIGELPSGIRDGLGGAILNFNQYYITGPEKLWASIFITAVVGIAFYLIVTALERLVLSNRHRPLDL
jgi:NitT/TauT family transport system permease protein